MKRPIRFFVGFIIVLIALVASMFSERALITDWVQNRLKPELPQAVSFEQVQEVEIAKTREVEQEIQETEDSETVELIDTSETEITDAQKAQDATVPLLENDLLAVNPFSEPEAVTVPVSFNLAVPFTPQAPFADWSAPFKETCEEASLYMVDSFYKKIKAGLIQPETANKAMLSLVDFQNEIFGFYEDTTIDQLATLAEMYYGYEQIEVIDDPTIDQIKEHISAGRPVIAPFAGRLLGNPYFQQPGPIYHMLVIRGFTTDEKFITNDPGTRRGEEFLYSFDTIMNAMHDWNGTEDITLGKKRILVIYPN